MNLMYENLKFRVRERRKRLGKEENDQKGRSTISPFERRALELTTGEATILVSNFVGFTV